MKHIIPLALALALALAVAVTIAFFVFDVTRLSSIDDSLAFAERVDLYPLPASIDVNGDGQPGMLHAVSNDSPYTDAILTDDGPDYLRFPYVDHGDSFRTTVGWVASSTGGRFYVFEGSTGSSSEVVYRFDGQALVRVEPDGADLQVLNALSTQSMYGRGFHVAAYRRTRPHIWFWLLLVDLLAIVALIAGRRFRTNAAQLAHAAECAQRDRSACP